MPVGRYEPIETAFQFDAVSVHPFDVGRRPKPFESRQPNDPVVDIGVEPSGFAVQRVAVFPSDGEFYAAVIGESVFFFQIDIAAGKKIEVVERREAIVARDGCLGDDIPLFREDDIGEKCRNDRCPFRSVHLFTQRERQPQPLPRPPFDRHAAFQFDTPFVVTYCCEFDVASFRRGHLSEVLGTQRVEHILVFRVHQMLMRGKSCRDEQFASD